MDRKFPEMCCALGTRISFAVGRMNFRVENGCSPRRNERSKDGMEQIHSEEEKIIFWESV